MTLPNEPLPKHCLRLWRCAVTATALAFSSVLIAGEAAAQTGSFQNDVMAVLSKAGCNRGVCHGNQHGKGGFKLSLRGDDPDWDFAALTRDQSARRVNRLDPDRSLILLKPTMQIAHEGGRRFKPGSVEYNILRTWIASGMPRDGKETPRLVRLEVTPQQQILISPASQVQLQVVAEFSDGSRRDVANLAVYEPAGQIVDVNHDGLITRLGLGETTVTVRFLDRQQPVRLAFVPARPNFQWTGPPPANFIDRHVFSKLRSLKINPSRISSDTVFLRRAFLDLLGLLPTATEARQFIGNRRPDKRDRLIGRLLKRQEFADCWAQKWSDLLRNEEKTLDRKGVENFHAWIRDSIAHDKPLDQFVRELVASRGSTYSNPPANYYRAMREPLMRAESTAQLFLGIRLQCAKCHSHPFDRWTQDDYYGWANLFARVNYKILENRRLDRNDKHEFDGEQVVYMASEGEVDNPRTGKPNPPQFLGTTSDSFQPQRDRLRQLAEWITRPDNHQFARSQVNRIWSQLLGRGIVDPVDDFRATNPPVNPELLDALAADFVAHRFSLRHMIRRIMNSRTYQLSAVPNETNRDDETNFSRSIVRRLSAEQLVDSLAQVSGASIAFNGYPAGMRAGELPGVRAVRLRDQTPSDGDQFLVLFGKPQRLQPCECERTNESTLSQTFQLVSGPLMNELLTRPENRLSRLLASGQSSAKMIDDLYWSALSRPPTPSELTATVRYLDGAVDRRKALEDITWALLNSNEFMLRQ